MKYIKTYEECTDEEKLIYDDCSDSWYWQVTTKYPDILIIFDKLGVPEGWGDWLWSEDNHLIKDIYIFKTIKNGGILWTYSGLDIVNPSWRKPPEFMGVVEVTEEDINEWKIKKEAERYNL